MKSIEINRSKYELQKDKLLYETMLLQQHNLSISVIAEFLVLSTRSPNKLSHLYTTVNVVDLLTVYFKLSEPGSQNTWK
jgi:hypothetical protein